MAAILCQGLGNCLQGICTCTSNICKTVCTAPCTVCNVVCKGCDDCCTNCCGMISSFCSNPFCSFVTVGLFCNVPIVGIGIGALKDFISSSSSSCLGETTTNFGQWWLIVAFIVACLNIGAAVYMAYSLQYGKHPQLQQRSTTISRVKYIVCFDPWIAAYIFLLIGYFIWLCMGISLITRGFFNNNNDNNDNNDNDNCNTPAYRGQVGTVVGLGFAYFLFGTIAMGISLCCASFDNREYPKDTTNNPPHGNHNHNNNNNNNNNTYANYHTTTQPSSTTGVSAATRSPPDVENSMPTQPRPPPQQQTAQPVFVETVHVEGDDPPIVYAEAAPQETTTMIPPLMKVTVA